MEVQQKSVKSAAVPEGAGWLKGNKKSQFYKHEIRSWFLRTLMLRGIFFSVHFIHAMSNV
jgi:hypothetical protein